MKETTNTPPGIHIINMKMMWQRYQKFNSYNPLETELIDTERWPSGLMREFTLRLPKLNSNIKISEVEDYINETCVRIEMWNEQITEIYIDIVVANAFIKHLDSDTNHYNKFDEYTEKIFGLRRNEEYDEYCLIKKTIRE